MYAEIPRFWWPTALIAIDCIFIVLSIVATSFASSFLRLRHVPGPWWAAYSRSWLMRVLLSGDAAAKFEEVNRKHGRHPSSAKSRRRQWFYQRTIAQDLRV